MKKEYIAYEGQEFTVEWYHNSNGKSLVLDFYKALDVDDRIKLLRLFKRIGDGGEIRDKTKFNSEGDKIYAFKPQPFRFLCFFFDGKKIIVTNAFHKKQDKLPKNEKERALSIKIDYEARIKRGNYYD
jgi:hypothetical protein